MRHSVRLSLLSCPREIRLLTVLLVGLLLLTGRAARAEIKLTLDAKDGDRISDVYRLVARATSGEGIDKVEFQIDDQLRATDTSVPYEYEWDTLADTEGAHKVTVTAFDSNGQTQRVSLTLTIDNELNLGADALAQKAQAAMQAKDTETAARYARRALKADPTHLAASRLMASLYAAKSDWNQAIAALEKAKIPDDATDVMAQLASYHLQRALLPENAANFAAEIQTVFDLRRKIADSAVEKTKAQWKDAGEPDKKIAAHQAIGDALLTAGRYREAAMEYQQCGTLEEAPVDCLNRLALAYTLQDQVKDAMTPIRTLTRQKRDDAATRAILGLMQLRQRQFREARATVGPDVSARFPAALVVAAFADTALGNGKDAAAWAREAAASAPGAGDAQYALAVGSPDPREADRALRRTLALAPFQYGPTLDYATRFILQGRTLSRDRIDQALNITDFVLKHEPDNVNAKYIQVLLYLQSGRATEAEPILSALLAKEGNALDLLLAGAVFQRATGQLGRVNLFLEAVRKLDAERYYERDKLNTPLQALFYTNVKMHYRADPFLTPGTLFPVKEAASAP
jgi:tetratricopeptide (TPR) repeat protein